MIDNQGQDYCSRCGKEITNDNLGYIIGDEEIIVCDSCADKHRLYVIRELNKFRKEQGFNDKIALRKKILWSSQEMGNCFDAGDKSYIENVYDYDNDNVFELQSDLLNIELDCVNTNLAEGGLGLPTKDNPELQELRKELLAELKKLSSYY